MLPAISEFLKGAVDESLKRLVQPSGIIAAAIFLLLNLLFIFPPLAAIKSPLVTGYQALDGGWQLVIGTTILLVLSYVLASLSNSILRLMTGELWIDSALIGKWLTNSQREKYRKLKKDLPKDTADPHQIQERYDFQQSYPVDEAYLMPTDLGNALNATSLFINRRYGIDMAALWPHMQSAIADDKALVARLDGDKATLDFLLNLSFMLMVFTVEAGMVYALLGQWLSVLLSLLFLLLAYLIYRTAVGQARSWGDAVEMAFDLHRNDLRTKLGLQEFKSRSEERRAWQEVSKWFIWGATGDEVKAGGTWDHDAFFDKPGDTATATVTCSDNVKVTHTETLITEAEHQEPKPPAQTISGEAGKIEYTVMVSHAPSDSALLGNACPPNSVFVLITDPRVPFIAKVPESALAKEHKWLPAILKTDQWHPTILKTDQSYRLLWQLQTDLPAFASRLLQYRLPIIKYRVGTDNKDLLVSEYKVDLRPAASKVFMHCTITLKGNADLAKAKVEVIDTCLTPTVQPTPAQIANSMQSNPRRLPTTVLDERNGYSWTLTDVKKSSTVTLTYSVMRE